MLFVDLAKELLPHVHPFKGFEIVDLGIECLEEGGGGHPFIDVRLTGSEDDSTYRLNVYPGDQMTEPGVLHRVQGPRVEPFFREFGKLESPLHGLCAFLGYEWDLMQRASAGDATAHYFSQLRIVDLEEGTMKITLGWAEGLGDPGELAKVDLDSPGYDVEGDGVLALHLRRMLRL